MSSRQLGAQLALVQRARRQLEFVETALEQQAIGAFRSGKDVPGWRMAPTPPKLQWSRPAYEVIGLGDLFGEDLRRPEAPITPTQARKSGIDPAILETYSERASSGAKLVPDDGTEARRIFK
jgi:hypothetical protein